MAMRNQKALRQYTCSTSSDVLSATKEGSTWNDMLHSSTPVATPRSNRRQRLQALVSTTSHVKKEDLKGTEAALGEVGAKR